MIVNYYFKKYSYKNIKNSWIFMTVLFAFLVSLIILTAVYNPDEGIMITTSLGLTE